MRNCLVLIVTLLMFLICGVSSPTLIASAKSQQTPTRILEPEQVKPGDLITVYEKSGQVLDLIVEAVVTADQANLDTGLTGTYISDITDNDNRYFQKENHRKLVVTFEQNGESIVGNVRSLTDGHIEGIREGDTIKFSFYSTTISNYEISGEWKFNADGYGLEGSWQHPVYFSSGKWNLTRLDPAVTTRHADPPMIKGRLVLDQSAVEVLLADIDKIEVPQAVSVNEVSTATVKPAVPLPETEPSKSSKSSNSEFSRNFKECMGKIAIYGLLPLTVVGADGAELSIFTSVFGTVFCVPLAGAVVTTEPLTKPSMDASVEASFRKNHAAYRKTEQHRFIALSGENLAGDMARGGGEYLTTIAYLEGCPVEVHDRFAQMTQRNFRQIIPQVEMDTASILYNLEAQIAKDPLLAKKCNRVS